MITIHMIHFTNITPCPENAAVAPLLRAQVVVLESNNKMSYRINVEKQWLREGNIHLS